MFNQTKYLLSGMVIIVFCRTGPAIAASPAYAGITLGPALSTENSRYESADGFHLFLGLQTEYYVTYEGSITIIEAAAGKDSFEIDILSLAALVHLPIGNSSIFARFGLSGWNESLNNLVQEEGMAPAIGAGLDLAITPRLSIRLEWQRFFGLENIPTRTDIDHARIGMLYYI